mgnify:CR=1 FL=1
MINFGDQRLVRSESGAAERFLFRIMGVADPAHYLHGIYFQRELNRLGDFYPSNILDAGCGAGDYTFYLARRYPRSNVLGVDINDRWIKKNRETAIQLGISNVQFQCHDMSGDDYQTQFDLVVSVDVLEYIADKKIAMELLFQAMKPKAMVFFHIPTIRERPAPFSRWSAKENPIKKLSADEFLTIVRNTGLEIQRFHRTFGLFTGELATGLYALHNASNKFNREICAFLAFPCRLLASADTLNIERTRYAVAVLAQKPD